MKLHAKVWAWLFWMLLMAAPHTALADICRTSTNQPSTFVFTPPASVKINPDVANGVVLATIKSTLVLQAPTEIECPGIVGSTLNRYEFSTLTYLGSNLYESGIPGIGLRFSFNGMLFPRENQFTFPYKDNGNWPGELQLIKTGPITRAGTLAGIKGRSILPAANNFEWRSFVIGSISVNPGKPTCKITTPSVSVPMVPASQRAFTGVGDVSAARDFSIDLGCSGGHPAITTAVYGVLTDQTNPDNRSTTLSLTRDSTAAGVGVQVLLDGLVLGYGADSTAQGTENRWLAGSSGNGNFTIPLSARYVQTLPEVTAGSANARATFTLSYE